MARPLTGGLVSLALLVFGVSTALAQTPPPPAPTPKPGYVVPPENSAGLYPVSGEPVFKARCAGCHEPAVGRAPSRALLGARAPEEVYDALTLGAMKTMAAYAVPVQKTRLKKSGR